MTAILVLYGSFCIIFRPFFSFDKKYLEAENEWLRQQAAPAVQNNPHENDGQHALQKLYDDGIHVCPAYFGKTHDGGCLLCMEVLSNVSN